MSLIYNIQTYTYSTLLNTIQYDIGNRYRYSKIILK